MEDENITSSAPVEGDVVQVTQSTNGITPAPEPSTPPMEATTETTPQTTGTPEYERVTPVPQTEKTLAEQYIDDARENAYLNKGHGIGDWIKNTYNYDQNQRGSMWVAGKINDVATQMSFLEATLNEDMYGELDLQKYFFDTNLATARAYAKEKKHETAYGYYRAAQEKALAEGDLIGWYMPAEAGYMLSQWAIANENLNNPSLGTMDKERAESVKRAVTDWFEANNITWRGIECLNHMYYQETVRHNAIMAELQQDANDIAREQQKANAEAAANSYKLQLRQWEFDMAELEKDFGYDITGDKIIGHNPNASYNTGGNRFGHYDSEQEWAENNLTAAFNLYGTQGMKSILGNRFQWANNAYHEQVQKGEWFKEQCETGLKYIMTSALDSWGTNTLKKDELKKLTDLPDSIDTSSGIKIVYTSPGSAALYAVTKDGVAIRINDSNMTLANGKTIEEVLKKQDLKLDISTPDSITSKNKNGEEVTLGIGKQTYSDYYWSPSKNNKSEWRSFTDKGLKGYNEMMSKGFKREYGLVDTEGIHSGMVFSDVDKDGNKIYYAFNPENGSYGKISDKNKIAKVQIDSDGTINVTHFESGKDWGRGWHLDSNNEITAVAHVAIKYSQTVGNENSKYHSIVAYINPDGSVIYTDETWHNENTYRWESLSKAKVYNSNSFDANKDLPKFEDSVAAYVNDINESDYTSKTTNEIIQENYNSISDSEREKLKSKVKSTIGTGSSSSSSSSSSGGSSSNNNNSNSLKSKKETPQVSDEKTSEEKVLADAGKDVDLGEKAKEEIEQNQERYNKLFNIT